MHRQFVQPQLGSRTCAGPCGSMRRQAPRRSVTSARSGDVHCPGRPANRDGTERRPPLPTTPAARLQTSPISRPDHGEFELHRGTDGSAPRSGKRMKTIVTSKRLSTACRLKPRRVSFTSKTPRPASPSGSGSGGSRCGAPAGFLSTSPGLGRQAGRRGDDHLLQRQHRDEGSR